MARRKKGRVVNGVLLLNKDVGLSSNSALQRVKHLLQAQKAGHGGTLDPFADGLLPILFGEATKFGQYLLGNDKRYIATAQFGAETDSDDKDGNITLETDTPSLAEVDWQSLLARFIGKQQQVPPVYSALKINGQRAYDLARQGNMLEMQPREVVVYDFRLLSHTPTTATFAIHCGKGTYVRALIRDMARAMQSSAHTIALTRTAVGQLSQPMYRYDDIATLSLSELEQLLLPIDACVQSLPRLQIPADKLSYLIHGNDVFIEQLQFTHTADDSNEADRQAEDIQDGLTVALYDQMRLLGVGRWHQSSRRVYPKRLLGQLSA